jgi:hypothetical protein
VLPLGHLTFAYLWYALYAASSTHRLPARLALLPLAFGSQFPDLIDKPLAYIGVLTYGRSLAHSVFAFVLVSGVVWWGATALRTRWPDTAWQGRLRRTTPVAFASGYLSHLLGDLYGPAIAGSADVRFVLYPIYAVPRAPGDDVAPWIRLVRIYREMGTHPQLELILLAAVVFVGLYRWSE